MARKGHMRLRWLDLRNMILFYIPCKDMAALFTNSDLIIQLDNVFYNMEVRDPETKAIITSLSNLQIIMANIRCLYLNLVNTYLR